MTILEARWLASIGTCIKVEVASFIYEMIVSRKHAHVVAEYKFVPFEVPVLAPETSLRENELALSASHMLKTR